MLRQQADDLSYSEIAIFTCYTLDSLKLKLQCSSSFIYLYAVLLSGPTLQICCYEQIITTPHNLQFNLFLLIGLSVLYTNAEIRLYDPLLL